MGHIYDSFNTAEEIVMTTSPSLDTARLNVGYIDHEEEHKRHCFDICKLDKNKSFVKLFLSK